MFKKTVLLLCSVLMCACNNLEDSYKDFQLQDVKVILGKNSSPTLIVATQRSKPVICTIQYSIPVDVDCVSLSDLNDAVK